MFELHSFATYHGPNPFSTDPVSVAEMSISDADLPRLFNAIPALQAQTADWYRPAEIPSERVSSEQSGPAERVGRFLADWALQALTYTNGYLQTAGCATQHGRVLVWVGFHEPNLSLEALSLGARWLTAWANGRPPGEDFPALLDQLWDGCLRHHPDYQARIIMEAARARGVPYAPALGLPSVWRFGHGRRSRAHFESSSCDDSRIGTWVQHDKALTKNAFRDLGIPTPNFRLVEQDSELEQAAAEVGYPCVTKPLDRGGGKGVTCGLTSLSALRDGFETARAFTREAVMVEACVEGEDHRLMVVDGRLAAAICRVPPSVTGDGRRTIAELVAAKNVGRDARSLVRSGYHRPIVLDDSANVYLNGMGLGPESVLAEGFTVRVRSNANLSTGGDCIDVTSQVHPDIRTLAESIARTLNLAMLGADFVSTDISRSPEENGSSFIEINITPGLDAMIAAGWPVERAGDLALGPIPGRIPLHLFVVAEQQAGQILAATRDWDWPANTGWAAWDQAANAGARLAVSAGAAWAGVHALLGHRTLERAVVIATDRQINEYGLPQAAFDSAHIACRLEPAWLEVLGKHCTEVRHYDGPDDSGFWPPTTPGFAP